MDMDLKLNDNIIDEASISDGRQSYTFTPTTPTDTLTLVHPDRTDGTRLIGDIVLKQVQLEQSSAFTGYTENTATESMIGAMMRGISELKTTVSDENGDITRMTKETLHSVMNTFQDIEKGTSTETLASDNGLYQAISNALTGDFNKQINTSAVFQSVIGNTKSDMRSEITQMGNSLALGLFGQNGMITGLDFTRDGATFKGDLLHITGQTIIDNAVIKSSNIESLTADKIKTGRLDAGLVNVINLNASNITAGTMSANRITGGILTALNGNTSFDLNAGNIIFNTSSNIIFNQPVNALKRYKNGSTGFLHFNDSSGGGVFVGLGVTSNDEGVKSQDTGRFAGIRIFRDSDTKDQTEIYGDKIVFGHAFTSNAPGMWLYPTKLKTNVDLVDFMRWCRTEIVRLHQVKSTETAYSWTQYGEF